MKNTPEKICDDGIVTGISNKPLPAKNAAQLQTERLVANSPRTAGQQLNDAWQRDPSSHPATKLGGVPAPFKK